MDDAHIITIGTFDRLQKLFESFLHDNKFVVVAMTSASSVPIEFHIYLKLTSMV